MAEENRTALERSYVTVEIYDQVYHLAGQDPEHIRELAARVDAKMRAVARRAARWTRCAWPCWRRSTWPMSCRRPARPTRAWAMRAPQIFAGCSMKCCEDESQEQLRRTSVRFPNHRAEADPETGSEEN